MNELYERIMGVLMRFPQSALRFVVIQLLYGGVKPPRGYAGFREQRQRTQLTSGRLIRAALQTVDDVFNGHPQCRCNVVRVVIRGHGANGVFLAVRLQ